MLKYSYGPEAHMDHYTAKPGLTPAAG